MTWFRSMVRLAVFLPGLLLATVCSAAEGDLAQAVAAGNQAFTKAFLAGDAHTVANLYTPEAKVIAPGNAVASGRKAITSFWDGVIATGVKDLDLDTLQVAASGDLAYEDGIVTLVSADGTKSTGRYVVVWKQTPAGWRMHRDIWNAGPPAKTP